MAFKALAAFAADLLSKNSNAGSELDTASSALKLITSNDLEGARVGEAFTLLALKSPNWPIR